MTEAEAEEMKYDPLYHQWRDPSGATPNPTGDDVRRILALPRNLNLALPFLFTPREIEWHRLLVKYSHGQRLEVYEDADARSAGMPLDEHGHEVKLCPLFCELVLVHLDPFVYLPFRIEFIILSIIACFYSNSGLDDTLVINIP